MKSGKIVVLDDNKNVLNALELLFRSHFEEATLIGYPYDLMETIRKKMPDIVLLDMNFKAGINTGNEGLYRLSEVKRLYPDLPVVLFTAYADIDLAVEALKRGASDFVVKPWDNRRLIETLRQAMGGPWTDGAEGVRQTCPGDFDRTIGGDALYHHPPGQGHRH